MSKTLTETEIVSMINSKCEKQKEIIANILENSDLRKNDKIRVLAELIREEIYK